MTARTNRTGNDIQGSGEKEQIDFISLTLITFLTFDFFHLSFADHYFRGRSVRQEAQSVRRGQDLQCGPEKDLWLDAADPEARGAHRQGPHEEDDGQGTQEQGHWPGPLQLVLWKVSGAQRQHQSDKVISKSRTSTLKLTSKLYWKQLVVLSLF